MLLVGRYVWSMLFVHHDNNVKMCRNALGNVQVHLQIRVLMQCLAFERMA